jgi:uncharacterized protein YdhG (YjbR/CyaY superfamily)
MTPTTSPVPKTVEEYLAKVPPRFQKVLRQLRKTIRSAAPDAEEVVSYRLPAFRQNGMLVYYGAFADHCSFFVGSFRVRKKFASELKAFTTGRGTVRFTPEHPLPEELVLRIVRTRVAENSAWRSKK